MLKSNEIINLPSSVVGLVSAGVVEPTSVKIYRNLILETLINACSIIFTDVCNRYQHTFDLKQN